MNVGCPSKRVRAGRFGACLMAEPERVAACVAAMASAVSIPVTVKTRIGIDDQDSYEALAAFIDTVSSHGCDTFIVHARKAWLTGLSPKQNRDVPPLRYDVVRRLKQEFPALTIVLNGGVTSLAQTREHLSALDGVMIGREAYHNPYLLARADAEIFNDDGAAPTRMDIVEAYLTLRGTGTGTGHAARPPDPAYDGAFPGTARRPCLAAQGFGTRHNGWRRRTRTACRGGENASPGATDQQPRRRLNLAPAPGAPADRPGDRRSPSGTLAIPGYFAQDSPRHLFAWRSMPSQNRIIAKNNSQPCISRREGIACAHGLSI